MSCDKPTREEFAIVKHYIHYIKTHGFEDGIFALCERKELSYLDSGAEKDVYNIARVPGFVLKVDNKGEEHIGRCEVECYVYTQAVKSGFGYLFAPTYFVGKINGRTLSLQKKVYTDECDTESSLCDYIDSKLDNFSGYLSDDEDDDIPYDDIIHDMEDNEIVQALTGEDSEEFVDFLLDYKINDLHTGNFGIDYDSNAYMIIDYCGYHNNMKVPQDWR